MNEAQGMILGDMMTSQQYCDDVVEAIQQVVGASYQAESELLDVINTLCLAYKMARQQ